MLDKSFQSAYGVKDEDYLDQVGKLSPTTLLTTSIDTLHVITVALPEDRFATYIDTKTLFHTIPDMPESLRINLLLTKSRYSIEYTSKVYPNMTVETYQQLVTSVIGAGFPVAVKDYIDIGFMPIPGVYCLSMDWTLSETLLGRVLEVPR